MMKAEIEVALIAVNRRCVPPLSHDECEGIAASVGKYPASDPPNVPSAPKGGGTTEGKIVFTPVDLVDLLSKAPEDIDWAIDGVLQSGTIMMISAEPYTSKTWTLLDLAIAVSRGDHWMGRKTTKGAVLIIDEEDSIADLQRRLQKLLRGRGLPPDGVGVDVRLLPLEGVNVSRTDHVAALKRVFSDLQPDLVIIDSFVRIHTADENEATKIAQVSGTLKRLVVEHECSMVISHHDRKPRGKSGGPPENRFRGSSEIRAFVDSHLDLEKTKRENCFCAHHVKLRAGRPLPPFDFEVKDVDSDGVVIEHLGEAATDAKAKTEKARQLILRIVEDGLWHSRKELVEAGEGEKLSRDRIDDARKELIAGGVVEDEMKGKETGISLVVPSVENDTHKGPKRRNENGDEAKTVDESVGAVSEAEPAHAQGLP